MITNGPLTQSRWITMLGNTNRKACKPVYRQALIGSFPTGVPGRWKCGGLGVILRKAGCLLPPMGTTYVAFPCTNQALPAREPNRDHGMRRRLPGEAAWLNTMREFDQ